MTGSDFDNQPHFDLFPGADAEPRPVRTLRPRATRVLIAASSLAVGAVAAGGTAMAIGHGPQDISAANTAAKASLQTAQKQAPQTATRDDSDDSGDADHKGDQRSSREHRGHGPRCVRLDAKALAAIAAAQKNGSAGKVRADKGGVVLPLAAIKVVSCRAPKPKPSTTSTSSAPAPAPKPTTTTTTAAPKTTTKTTTTAPKTTAPKTTTTKPKPSTSTTTAAS